MENWIEIGTIDDIPRLGARIIKTPTGDIAIFRNAEDKVFALDDRCPHKGGPLSQGIIHGTNVTCPLHNWVIGLEDGKAAAPDIGCAKTYPIKVEGGTLHLSLAETDPTALDSPVIVDFERAANE